VTSKQAPEADAAKTASSDTAGKRRRPTHGELAFVAILGLTLAGWLVWATCGASISAWFLNGANAEQSGNWGDSFGAFNALVSAAGFGGVLVTLALQRKALRQQQDDALSQSRERHRQEFDRTFFQLLELMRDVRGEIFFRYSPAYVAASGRKSLKTAHGPEALSRASREVAYWIRKRAKEGPLTADELARTYVSRVHTRAETRLGPYYRVIYTILRRISEIGF
jgi:hypothetical protein